MIGFFICLDGLFSAFTAPFSAAVSSASAIAAHRQQIASMRAAQEQAKPKVVEGQTSIPRVKRNAT